MQKPCTARNCLREANLRVRDLLAARSAAGDNYVYRGSEGGPLTPPCKFEIVEGVERCRKDREFQFPISWLPHLISSAVDAGQCSVHSSNLLGWLVAVVLLGNIILNGNTAIAARSGAGTID